MDYIPAKTKKTQVKLDNDISERDCFLTPRYAVDILIPFLKKAKVKRVWECASGSHNMIAKVFDENGFVTYKSDLNYNPNIHNSNINFLSNELPQFEYDMIITNPPFSLKKEFYENCMKKSKKFALLVPADYSGWILDAIKNGCQRITPTRRIDYITPNTLQRINDWDVMEEVALKTGIKYKKPSDVPVNLFEQYKKTIHQYSNLEEIGNERMRKATSSDFHSYWLTYGLELDDMEVIVDLDNSEKVNIW